MPEIELEVIETHQPIGSFYIAKINAKTLYNSSRVDRLLVEMQKEVNELKYSGIQRNLNEKKIRSLQDYLESPDATFPNSIILNVDKNYILSQTKSSLTLKYTKETFSVIDGQHRLESFRDLYDTDFELVVSIFLGLSIEEQARIFITINSEQTKVNPSVQIFQELHDKVYTPRKMAANIAILFAKDFDSPWLNKIKLLGVKDEIASEGIISLSAFAKPIINLIYDDEKYHFIRTQILRKGPQVLVELPVPKNSLLLFWDLFIQNNEPALYKMLFNYFKVISNILPKDWKSNSSLLTKTTGYNALILLFKDIYELAEPQKDFSQDNFYYILKRLKSMDGTINSSNYGASGDKAAIELYRAIKKHLDLNDF